MDSKAVNKEIRAHIWSELRKAGFSVFTSRSAWRHSADQVDVINFQSFNSYLADGLGVTTYSFAINLGMYLLYIPQTGPCKMSNSLPAPEETACNFRGRIKRKIDQPKNNHQDIWMIDESGNNLHWCIRDVQQSIPSALAWFERLHHRDEVLRILLEDKEALGDLWGFGNIPSPIRSYLTGYVAYRMGDRDLASTKLQEAVDSKCFTYLFSSLQGAINRAL